jgi:hypothetical protein
MKVDKLSQYCVEARCRPLRKLGRGGEGTVYLMQELDSDQRFVLKLFYEPIRGSSTQGLKIYAQKIKRNKYGLPPIVLVEAPDQIVGVRYPYTPLYNIYWRLFQLHESVAQSLFGAYCRMQYYLMTQGGIGLLDTVADNFMSGWDGTFYFVDYGFGIKSVEHGPTLESGKFGYGFVMMLLSIYQRNLKSEMLPSTNYDYNVPCVYCQSKLLDEVSAEQQWVKELLTEVRSCKASIFVDPEFYKRLSSRLPGYMPFSRSSILFSKLVFSLQSLRKTNGNVLRS